VTTADRIVVGFVLIMLAGLGEAQGWPGMWLASAFGWAMVLRAVAAAAARRHADRGVR
jgi:hypothetical protein